MNKNKSFWAWLIGGIGMALKDLRSWVYKNWYVVFLFISPGITFVSLMQASWYYRPTWVDTDYAITGSFGYFADPKIMPWMILYPAIGVAMFMLGLYGHWREEVKVVE